MLKPSSSSCEIVFLAIATPICVGVAYPAFVGAGRFFALVFFFFATRCCGGLFPTTTTARSKRCIASEWNSISRMGFFAMPSPLRIDNPRMNDHAQAIGYLCFLYNGLEANANNLVGLLASLSDTDLECFTNEIDLKKKLPIIKALAFQRQPSKIWFDDIELFSWAVGSQIIPKRNRYVHDIWLGLPSVTVRRYERTRIGKAQALEKLTLTTHEHITTTAEEIWTLVRETSDISNIFRHLYEAFKDGRAASEPEKVIPQQYRDQWLVRQKPPKGPNSAKCCGPTPEEPG